MSFANVILHEFQNEMCNIVDSKVVTREHVASASNIMKKLSVLPMNYDEIGTFLKECVMFVRVLDKYFLECSTFTAMLEIRLVLRMAMREFLSVIESLNMDIPVAKLIGDTMNVIVCNDQYNIIVRVELLKIYSQILDKLSWDFARVLAATIESFEPFYKIMINASDIETQAVIIELILKLFNSTDFVNEEFQHILHVVDIRSINRKNIYQRIRMLLDGLNIHSPNLFYINCNTIELGNRRIVEFEGSRDTDDIWLDFNIPKRQLSFFCYAHFLHTFADFNTWFPTSPIWEILSFTVGDILSTEFNYDKESEILNIMIKINKGILGWFANADDMIDIKISISSRSARFGKLIQYILPTMFGILFSPNYIGIVLEDLDSSSSINFSTKLSDGDSSPIIVEHIEGGRPAFKNNDTIMVYDSDDSDSDIVEIHDQISGSPIQHKKDESMSELEFLDGFEQIQDSEMPSETRLQTDELSRKISCFSYEATANNKISTNEICTKTSSVSGNLFDKSISPISFSESLFGRHSRAHSTNSKCKLSGFTRERKISTSSSGTKNGCKVSTLTKERRISTSSSATKNSCKVSSFTKERKISTCSSAKNNSGQKVSTFTEQRKISTCSSAKSNSGQKVSTFTEQRKISTCFSATTKSSKDSRGTYEERKTKISSSLSSAVLNPQKKLEDLEKTITRLDGSHSHLCIEQMRDLSYQDNAYSSTDTSKVENWLKTSIHFNPVRQPEDKDDNYTFERKEEECPEPQKSAQLVEVTCIPPILPMSEGNEAVSQKSSNLPLEDRMALLMRSTGDRTSDIAVDSNNKAQDKNNNIADLLEILESQDKFIGDDPKCNVEDTFENSPTEERDLFVTTDIVAVDKQSVLIVREEEDSARSNSNQNKANASQFFKEQVIQCSSTNEKINEINDMSDQVMHCSPTNEKINAINDMSLDVKKSFEKDRTVELNQSTSTLTELNNSLVKRGKRKLYNPADLSYLSSYVPETNVGFNTTIEPVSRLNPLDVVAQVAKHKNPGQKGRRIKSVESKLDKSNKKKQKKVKVKIDKNQQTKNKKERNVRSEEETIVKQVETMVRVTHESTKVKKLSKSKENLEKLKKSIREEKQKHRLLKRLAGKGASTSSSSTDMEPSSDSFARLRREREQKCLRQAKRSASIKEGQVSDFHRETQTGVVANRKQPNSHGKRIAGSSKLASSLPETSSGISRKSAAPIRKMDTGEIENGSDHKPKKRGRKGKNTKSRKKDCESTAGPSIVAKSTLESSCDMSAESELLKWKRDSPISSSPKRQELCSDLDIQHEEQGRIKSINVLSNIVIHPPQEQTQTTEHCAMSHELIRWGSNSYAKLLESVKNNNCDNCVAEVKRDAGAIISLLESFNK